MHFVTLVASCLLGIFVHFASGKTVPSFCKPDPSVFNASSWSRDGECPANFTAALVQVGAGKVYGACFLATPYDVTFGECRQACLEHGAHLPVFRSQEVEAYFVDTFHEKHHHKRYWLGLSDESDEGNWRWSYFNTSEKANYTNWKAGEPNDSFTCGEHFASIELGEGWVDLRKGHISQCACQVANVGPIPFTLDSRSLKATK